MEYKIPNHIAIIPDGNRRWAEERNFPSWVGHYEGAKTFEKLLREAVLPMGVNNMSLWIASFDNLTKRPEEEVKKLCELFADYFLKIVDHRDVHKYKVRVSVYGELEELFPKSVVEAVRSAEEKTKKYSEYFLNFFMGYDGAKEVVSAVREIVADSKKLTGVINTDTIKSHLWTKDLPPVDLLIRTGVRGDPHLSGGFLMWHTMYSQLYFAPEYFPDFGPEKLKEAIEDYSRRERRFGG